MDTLDKYAFEDSEVIRVEDEDGLIFDEEGVLEKDYAGLWPTLLKVLKGEW